MPTIRQSSLVDRSRMQPAEPPQSAMHHLPTQPVVAPAPDNTLVVSPFMQGSLPPQASGADVYTRQFYRRTGGPRQRRFMPVTVK